MEKTIVRKKVRKILQTITPEEIREKSALISKTLLQSIWWRDAEIILAFCSMEKEVDTSEIIRTALGEAKIVGVPRIEGNYLIFHRIRDLEKGFSLDRFGIREPDPSWPVVDPSIMRSQKFLIVTPGLAFDRRKNRLGKGKGFYDRFLFQARKCNAPNVLSIGVCFSEQLLERIPVGDHDQPVDGVITEKEMYMLW